MLYVGAENVATLRVLRRYLNKRIPALSANQVLACVSIVGAVTFFFVLGAAVMHFDLPTSDFLRNAFLGAQALDARGRSTDPATAPQRALVNQVTVDIPGRTDDGFTLYSTTHGSWAALIDMTGRVVHHWHMPFSKARPFMTNVYHPLPDEQIHWFGCWLYPNGDLLAVYHADGDTPFGYGLVKMDNNSNLLWAYPGRVHHDVHVGEDGTIYCIKHRLTREPPPGMDYVVTPYIADDVVLLSPEGKELKSVSLLQAFRDSPYAPMLHMYLAEIPNRGEGKGDYLHPNRVAVLEAGLAAKFPRFKAGQVLVSLRNIDTIAVLDLAPRTVVWASQGPWRGQHAAGFLSNGCLLLYDNIGGLERTRVLEFDPVNQAIPWCYASQNFTASIRGTAERLENGNTLIADPGKCRIFEVTPTKEIVWESFCLEPVVEQPGGPSPANANINAARRYRADRLTFLKGGTRARP